MHEIDDFLSLDLGFASWQNDDRISRSRRPSHRCRILSPRVISVHYNPPLIRTCFWILTMNRRKNCHNLSLNKYFFSFNLDLGFASWQNDDRISRPRRPSERCRISSPRIPSGLSLGRSHSELLGPRKLQPGIKIWEGHRSSQVCKLLISFFQLRTYV